MPKWMIWLALMSVPALADEAFVDQPWQLHIDSAEVVGQARLSVYLWDVYDATLYAKNGQWQAEKPYALRLEYLRNIKGKSIAKRSVEEIRKLGFDDEIKLSAWYSRMLDIFPDVTEGSHLTGIHLPGQGVFFFDKQKQLAEVRDAEFGHWFFAIWLSEQTSEPDMRKALLALQ